MIDLICTGRAAEKPEMKKTASGLEFCNLIITSDKPYLNSEGKVEKEDFSFICWKTTAADVVKNVQPGMLLQIKGRAAANNYRADEKFVFRNDLVAEKVYELN